ncbi:MAG: hypothetical protein E5Y52_01975 [Mesorhizobium sp.]|nr:MAG: hypothetical protein E5Y52_01975 [Mesorhizobium sp.]TIR72221.1 MAG: hypothetical protein E5X24_02380 [Mesorhizobium sp.]
MAESRSNIRLRDFCLPPWLFVKRVSQPFWQQSPTTETRDHGQLLIPYRKPDHRNIGAADRPRSHQRHRPGDGRAGIRRRHRNFWNDIQTAKRNGKIVFLDEAGDEWTFDQLTREDVDEEEEDACDGPDPRTAELQEIADGAFGDGPMARGAARDMLKREQR